MAEGSSRTTVLRLVSRTFTLSLSFLLVASTAAAEGPRVHVAGGAARAVGGPQGGELGTGGGASGTLEVPLASAFGVQAGAGTVVLSSSSRSPDDPAIAKRSTGYAVFGTVGARVHPFGKGPWLDANAGVGQTGGLVRPLVDANVGWEFQVSRSGVGVGPFVGYTQIVQPNDSLRGDDARIVLAGLTVSFGGRAPPAPLPATEPTPPPVAQIADHDGELATDDACPAGTVVLVDQGCGASIDLVDDRIVLGDIIHFDFGSPAIRPSSRRLVAQIARFLGDHPELAVVSIEGHADAYGTEEFNQRLSEDRAASTRAMLVELGVDAARLKVLGFGKSRLKVRTQRAEAKNRRVEFIVIKREALGPVSALTIGQRGKP